MTHWNKLLVLITAITIMSCGENKEVQTDKFKGEVAQLTVADESISGEAINPIVEITISANDQMQFDKKEIKVKAGQKVKLTLKHTGKMAKNMMGHNFVLLKKGTDVAAFGNAAATAADNAYIPKGTKQVIAKTKILGGGEQTTIEFDAPAKGTYTFICSFPGHYAIMKGAFIVQ